MTLEDAKRILMENRPYQPRKIEHKKFQQAIDTILDFLKDYPSDDEIQKNMRNTYIPKSCGSCKYSFKEITAEPCMICNKERDRWEDKMPFSDSIFDFENVYYKTKDGNYIKMADVKPLSITEIQSRQNDIQTIPVSLDLSEKSLASAIIENADEFMMAIEAKIKKEELDVEMYVICEMAKRYVYLMSLNDKEAGNDKSGSDKSDKQE